jgi:hypothetical protein
MWFLPWKEIPDVEKYTRRYNHPLKKSDIGRKLPKKWIKMTGSSCGWLVDAKKKLCFWAIRYLPMSQRPMRRTCICSGAFSQIHPLFLARLTGSRWSHHGANHISAGLYGYTWG